MQYGFYVNQRAVTELGLNLDFTDIAIYEFIKSYAHSKSVVRLEDGSRTYFWISWKLILDEIPMIKVKTRRSVINHMNALIDAKLIARREDNTTSSKSYYTFGEIYDTFEGFKGCEEKSNTCENNFTPPVKKISHNQYIDIIDNNKETTTNVVEKKDEVQNEHPKLKMNLGSNDEQLLPTATQREDVPPERKVAANHFYISSVERASVMNDPDRIAEIKRSMFADKVRAKAHELGMDRETFTAFVDYWTQHNEGSETVLCETVKSGIFDVPKRMATWLRNNRQKSQQTVQTDYHRVQRQMSQADIDNLYDK